MRLDRSVPRSTPSPFRITVPFGISPAGLAGILILTLGLSVSQARSADAAVPAVVDSIYLSGLQPDNEKATLQAIADLESRLGEGDLSPVHTRIGLLYLHLRQGEAAAAQFERALKADPQDAVAHAGLGRIPLEIHGKAKAAIPYFKAAVAADSTYARGFVYLSKALLGNGKRSQARRAAGTALKLDASSSEAYLVLGKSYEQEDNLKAATTYFKKFLELGSVDQTEVISFATQLFKQKRRDLVQELVPLLTEEDAMPLVAQVLVQQGDAESALEAFRRYFEALPDMERTYYEDLTLVGLPREVRAFRATPAERREDYTRRFWMQKDPLKATGGVQRRVEHYRRVWFARTFYSKKQEPWDRRGEVYIRYGEPAYRSASKDLNFQKPLAVQRVQEVLAHQLYGDKGLQMNFLGPVWPIRTTVGAEIESENSQAAVGPDEIFGFRKHKPVTTGTDWSAVPWEVWVYTNIGNGMEITFTDEFLSERYDFAPIPSFTAYDLEDIENETRRSYLRMVERLADFSSAAQIEELKFSKPEIYDLTTLEPLDFYYEALTFRNEDDGSSTDVQVTLGIPVDNLVMKDDGDTTVTVQSRAGLFTDRAIAIQRIRKDLSVPLGSGRRKQGRLAVDRIDMTAPPGEYLMPVQAWRRDTDLTGVYPQRITLPDYSGPGLKLSDIQIARDIREASQGADTTFVRRNYEITPWPPATFFPGEPLFVYMEVYNLERDRFGRTRFQVGYEVRATGDATDAPQAPFMPVVKKRDGESVQVRYEQSGTDPDVYEYWELNLGQVKPGNYTLKVNVKDLNNGVESIKEHDFRITKPKR